MVPYLSTGLVGCSVDPGNSRDARKLTRTPRVIKKKNNNFIFSSPNIEKVFFFQSTFKFLKILNLIYFLIFFMIDLHIKNI
jgi:hypothetical protein